MGTQNYLNRAIYVLILLASLIRMGSAQKAPLNSSDNPRISRERIEWLDVWVDEGQTTTLPRVLLIGDSITRAYYKEVEASLTGHAAVARLATSKSATDPAFIEEVSLLLREYNFDVIHFNVGNHGLDASDEQYRAGLLELIKTLKTYAPAAKLIWATTTPVRSKRDLGQFSPKNAQVIDRNSTSIRIMKNEGIRTDDLYTLVKDHPEYYLQNDGIHFNEVGIKAEGAAVTDAVSSLLSKP